MRKLSMQASPTKYEITQFFQLDSLAREIKTDSLNKKIMQKRRH